MSNKTTWHPKKWTPKPKPTKQHKNVFLVMAMTEEELAAVVAAAKAATPPTEEEKEGSSDEQ